MYICTCAQVTKADIHLHIAGTAANSIAAVSAALGVATGCGRCLHRAEAVVAEAVAIKAIRADLKIRRKGAGLGL
jgi:bacterioferritin-associated ferredoxin